MSFALGIRTRWTAHIDGLMPRLALLACRRLSLGFSSGRRGTDPGDGRSRNALIGPDAAAPVDGSAAQNTGLHKGRQCGFIAATMAAPLPFPKAVPSQQRPGSQSANLALCPACGPSSPCPASLLRLSAHVESEASSSSVARLKVSYGVQAPSARFMCAPTISKPYT